MADRTLAAVPETVDDLHAVFFDALRPARRSAIPTAVDHAYEMIWRQLIKGERRPGERLTDTELSLQMGLSRTPVRQALHRLAQEELVRLDVRRGFSVRELTAQDVDEIYEVRGVLETLALRQGAHRLTRDQIQEQLNRLYSVRKALRSTPNERAIVLHLEADLKLHNLLIHSSGNGRLIRMLGALRIQQTLFQYWDTSYPERNEAASQEHERILLSLAKGDTERAAEHLAGHIANAKQRVLMDLFGVVTGHDAVASITGLESSVSSTVREHAKQE